MNVIEIKPRDATRNQRLQDIRQAIEQMRVNESASVGFATLDELKQARNHLYYFFNTRPESRLKVSCIQEGLNLVCSKERK